MLYYKDAVQLNVENGFCFVEFRINGTYHTVRLTRDEWRTLIKTGQLDW